MRRAELNHRIYHSPFRPFQVHLSDGSVIPVTHAGMVLVSETSAILPTEFSQDSHGYPLVKRWRTVEFSHMVQLSEIDKPSNGKRLKKRG